MTVRTRFAPSPTGYLHLGGLRTALYTYLFARQNGGKFILRIEDTDQEREVPGAVDMIYKSMRLAGLDYDEGPDVGGDYGPYIQTQRRDLYMPYALELVEKGAAYPCFCTQEQLDEVRQRQEAEKQRTGYYGAYAACRDRSPEEALEEVRAGRPYVVRLRSPGSEERRIKFDDLIRGVIEMPENDQDIVLLKSDGIPTYHFAHAVDDHLMRTTHVIRGDEWIASTPIHLQLFRLLGFKPPKYVHVSPIMKEDNGGRRKISKRKDPEAAVRFFAEEGYPADCVMEYLMTIASSDYEDWRRRNPDAPRSAYPFNLKKMSPSGALFNADKLNDVSKNVIGRMDAETVTAAVLEWAAAYAPDFHALLNRDPAYARGIFSIDRGGPKPRKDLAKWADAPDYAAYYFDESFSGAFELPENIDPADAVAILQAYREGNSHLFAKRMGLHKLAA